MIDWKTPYNHDTEAESNRTGSPNNIREEDLYTNDKLSKKDIGKPMPSLTRQSEAQQADINVIMRNFGVTGILPTIDRPPTYEDFSEVHDYYSAQNEISKANARFYQLDAQVRAQFQNDPGQWLGYVDDCLETGRFEPLRKMGLILPAELQDRPETPQPAQGASPAPEPPAAPPKGL